MVQFDNQYRQIKIKIVYYGPALGGKTTCLQHIHRVTDPQRRTKLYSLNTASDRTLFFDLLALNLGRIRGYRLAMQLYTVPGQVQYNATRRAVLSGADGVVFVADSQVDQRQANVQSLHNLWENLGANGLEAAELPLVFQFNKRDLDPLIPVAEMARDLNSGGSPAYPSIALTGEGVMEGFAAVSERTLAAVADKLGVGSNQQTVERLQDQVRAALRPFVKDSDRASAPAPFESTGVQVTVPDPKISSEGTVDPDVLVGEAVRANMAMTDLNARLDTLTRALERRSQVLAGITEFSGAVASERDPAGVLQLLVESACRLLEVQACAVLMVPGSGPLQERTVEGMDRDPLLASADEAGEPLALGLLNQRRPRLFAPELGESLAGLEMAALERAGFECGLVAPMIVQDRTLGLLTAYAAAPRRNLDEDDLRLGTILASAAAVGFTNARAWRQLRDVNATLEQQVARRTEELRTSLDEVQRLNTELAERHGMLETAHRELSELDRVKNELITRISHELKTPVTSLVTAAKILDRYRDAPVEKGERFVSIIASEAAKLSEIVQSVVQASVLATAHGRAEGRPVEIGDLLRHVVAPLRDLAAARRIRLHLLVPGDLERLWCDPDTMETALRAVVKNAIEFNREDGDVRLEVRRAQHDSSPWVVIRVTDTGVGITEAELDHVFDAFWQGGNLLTDKPRGVGLGLTIARRVVANHGGTIRITAEEGRGTAVTISLPSRP